MARLRSKVRKLETWLQTHEDKVGPSGKIRQSNLTDNESAKMPGSHGVVQGYNGVAAVDAEHQVIVHAEAFGEGTEHALLKPMIEVLAVLPRMTSSKVDRKHLPPPAARAAAPASPRRNLTPRTPRAASRPASCPPQAARSQHAPPARPAECATRKMKFATETRNSARMH